MSGVMSKGYELLAPCGSMGAVYAAVQSGADAIYIGGKLFSARAGAGNFEDDEIIEIVKYCHLRGVKVFVALNTLIKQSEFNDAVKFAHFLYTARVDSIIVQDFGIANAILKMHPDFPLHASTQMTIHNSEDARALKDIGFKRVVLARELSSDEIKKINDSVDIETEIFVHGAICQCYSGQCLLSSIIGQRSGNRGKCAQPCRLEYQLLSENEKRKGYLLSPKDMCLIEHINEIKKLGSTSFKIEGRLKKPEYVATVVGIYSKYLKSGKPVLKSDYDALLAAFNRSGFTDGYFKGKLGYEMMTYKNPSNIAKEAFEDEAERRCTAECNLRKVPVKMKIRLFVGERACLEMIDDDGNAAKAFGEVAQSAKSIAATEEFITKQISRLGNTVYYPEEIKIDIDFKAGIGAKDLNELRRKCCEELSNQRLNKLARDNFGDYIYKAAESKKKDSENNEVFITASVSTVSQAKIAIGLGVKRIYAKENIFNKIKSECGDCELVLMADEIKSDAMCDAFKYEKEVLSAHLADAKKGAYGDFRLNVFNSESIKFYKQLGFKTICMSPELNIRELKSAIGGNSECEIMAYGRLPLMVMKNCVIKAALGKCMRDKTVVLKDRMNEEFLVRCEGDRMCVNTILNSKPIYMADKAEDLIDTGAKYIRLAFSDEDESKCRSVILAYQMALSGKEFKNADCFVENGFTRGHFYRGVK